MRFIFFLILSCFSTLVFAEAEENCQVDAQGRITNNSTDGSGAECSIQPDIQRIKFYKLALCTSEPTAPTAVSAVNLSSCTTIWENTSGSSLDILKDTAQKLDGAVTIPMGTFSHFYLEIDPVIGTQAQRNFATPRKGSIAGGGTGTTCWSVALDTPYYSERNPAINPIDRAANCGSTSEANPGVSNQFNNEAGGGFADTFVTSQGFTIEYYLVKDNYMLPPGLPVAESAKGITKIIAWGPQNITISNDNAKIQLLYNNSQGSELAFENGGDYPGSGLDAVEYLSAFGAGPFDMYIRVVN